MSENIYETADSVAQYLHFHYGEGKGDKAADFLPDRRAFDFPIESVTRLLDLDDCEGKSALDLGCSVGRSSLELSRYVGSVVGSDLSTSFVDAARNIASGKTVGYSLAHDGGVVSDHQVRLPQGSHPERVEFRVGDALEESGTYDIIHASNLLCRVPDPARLLDRLPRMLETGGLLALATPGSWLEEFTPRANWPAAALLDYLKAHLEPRLELIREIDLPFVIREHDRKFQLGISLGTCWRKR